MDDTLAKDILRELDPRKSCGAFVTEKVGRRGWERPRVSISPRLYRRYRVSDPWDPMAPRRDEDVGLGPVALRLGEQRRQPAPHLKPKEPKKKPAPNAAPSPRIPSAPQRSAQPKPTAKPADKPAEDPEIERLKAVAEQKRRQAEQARAWPRRRTTAAPSSEPARTAPVPALPVRPEARGEVPAVAGDDPEPQRALPPARSRPSKSGSGKTAGRFRMKPSVPQNTPVVRDVDAPEPVLNPEKPTRVASPKAKPRSIGTGGLDDLFGAAAQAGRMRIAKPTAPSDAEE